MSIFRGTSSGILFFRIGSDLIFKEIFQNVRQKNPWVHNITNYVTANDCANMLLACGASPVMADDVEDVEEFSLASDGLNINIGTLNQRTIPAMLKAGKIAASIGHPIILDPVGAGATTFRTNTALELLNDLPVSVIRANISEIKALAGVHSATKGVDADLSDQINEENLEETIRFLKDFAKKINCVVSVSGPIDIVADGKKAFCIRNGHPKMSSVTGTGCQLSALTAAFAAANPDSVLEAAASAAIAMGLCGEIAYKRLSKQDGNASYRNYIIDAMDRLTPEDLEKGARYEVR